MAHFERREWADNTYFPEIAGVDFTRRIAQFMGEVAANGTEIYTAWFVDGEHEEQVTPDTTRVFLSLVDDDSDTITMFDRRDGLWFSFLRANDPETFPTVLGLVMPWATATTSLTPATEVYQRFIAASTRDAEAEELHIPDDWLK
jgi:hypothetical protein